MEPTKEEPQTEERKANSIGVTLTDAAAKKILDLLALESRAGLKLRVVVKPGGCSGLSYQLFFDDREFEGDTHLNFSTGQNPPADRVTVAIDRESISYLSKAKIDYAETAEEQGFTIDNPNATSACACGDAFH
ncbi:HesB/IscA family protein [Streptomyces sp. NPDC090080]|uniref:HesB/IscA family protein n=1 Tax=Streptomyces sp. NPDC090080 TaxID=3365939 RepID=UPI00381C9E38